MVNTAASSVFGNIFGTNTQGLSIFSNNAFCPSKPTTPIANGAELEGSTRTSQSQASKEGAKIRVPEVGQEEGKKSKKKKKTPKLEQASLDPLSYWIGSRPEVGQEEGKKSKKKKKTPKLEQASSDPLSCWIGSRSVWCKKDNAGSRVKEDFSAINSIEKNTNSLLGSHGAVPKKELKLKADSKGRVQNGLEITNAGSSARLGKRNHQDEFEQKKRIKKQKTNRSDNSMSLISSDKRLIDKSPEYGSAITKTITKRKTDGSPDAKHGKKCRKSKDSLEAQYEKKLRGTDNISTLNNDPEPSAEIQEEGKSKGKETGSNSGKRKIVEGDEQNVETTVSRQYDSEEKLKRTVFVGNLPLKVKMKALINEFSVYGPVESVRLRSVPLLDTKIPRKGAIIKGQINEAVDSQHAYVVFENTECAVASLAHNMKEFHGKHLRVDAAHAPHQSLKGKSSLLYDPKRSIFVGNLPFDVKDEELYQTFGNGKSPDMHIEAIRVVRDPHTSVSKGIAYVLFKTNAGVLPFLSSKHKVKLRDRMLRISRVVASQSMRKNPSPSKHAKRVIGVDSSQPERKRAKLSASYQGVRANKERRKAAGRNDGQQRVRGSLRGESRGTPKVIGSKRNRVEKPQRGISRSKKIRRT